MSDPVIEIAKNLFRVPTMGSGINSFFITESDGSITLIDTGLKTAPKKLVTAIKYLQKDPSDIKRVLFTHSHDDHAGGAAKIIEIIGSPRVYAHEAEAQYLESGKNPPRDLTHLAGFF